MKQIRGVLLFFICVVSCTATNIVGFTIPRFNNMLTAMWLIYCGYILNQVIKVQYENKWIVIASGILVYHIASLRGGVSLNNNLFPDVLSLTLNTIASLYIICYFAKKIGQSVIGKCLAYCGKESFYIMALHFVGFKIMTIVLNICGGDYSLSALIAPSKGNLLLTIMYIGMGIIFPLCFMSVFRWLKDKILSSRIRI